MSLFQLVASEYLVCVCVCVQLPSTDYMDVKSCFRSKTEDVERRFCFEVEFYLSPQRYIITK